MPTLPITPPVPGTAFDETRLPRTCANEEEFKMFALPFTEPIIPPTASAADTEESADTLTELTVSSEFAVTQATTPPETEVLLCAFTFVFVTVQLVTDVLASATVSPIIPPAMSAFTAESLMLTFFISPLIAPAAPPTDCEAVITAESTEESAITDAVASPTSAPTKF